MPKESAFAEVTSFSLSTVQRAYRQLVDFGTVEQRQGAGSFVATRSPIKTDDWHLPLITMAGGGFIDIVRDGFVPGPI